MAKTPDIPSTQDVPTGPLGWLRGWLDTLRVWIQTRDPQVTTVGTPGDKFTTRGELASVGVLRLDGSGRYTLGIGSIAGPRGDIGPQGSPGAGVPTPDLTPPPTPTGLTVSAGITTLLIEWNAPTYTVDYRNALTLIYGAIWADGDTEPVFSDVRTKLITTATEASSLVAYSTNPDKRWCIWIAFKTRDGISGVDYSRIAGGAHGVQARTGQDVAALLRILTGSIRESHLYNTLGARIDLIDAADSVAGSVAARVKTERDALVAADVTTLSSANSYTASYAYAKANGEQVALDLTTLNSIVVSPTTGLAATRATLINDYATIAGATNSLASVTTSLQAYATSAAGTAQSNAASYTNIYAYAKTTGEALAGTVSTLTAVANAASLGRPFTAWTLSGQTLVDLSDGKVGRSALRLIGNGGYSNQGNYVAIDRTKKYRVRFWARPMATTAGLLYFSLQQFTDSSDSLGPDNGGRSPYKPSGQSRSGHNVQFGGTDQWGEYSYIWDSADWQNGVQFVRPDFLDNYPSAAGYWDIQDFSFTEVTGAESLSARITDVSTVTAAADLALAQRSTTLEASVNNPTDANNPTRAALSTEASTRAALDGSVAALYTVRVEASAAGATVIGGFGLSATSTVVAGPRIDFGVRADRFYIAAPSTATGVPDRLPFMVQTTSTVINGVTIPAGVYMDAAFIYDLTASIARLGSAWIDDAKIASVSAGKLTAGSVSVGEYAQSTGFVSGSAGWRISGNGNAEFSGVVVRGTIYASAGLIGGNTIDATGIQSPGYAAGSTGFRFDTSGLLRAFASSGARVFDMAATGTAPVFKFGSVFEVLANGAASYSGNLNAAGGTYAGTLTAAAINAVDTINLAGNAVTVPIGGTVAGIAATTTVVTTRTTTVTIGTITTSNTGRGQILLWLAPTSQPADAAYRNSSPVSKAAVTGTSQLITYRWRVYRNSTVVYERTVQDGSTGGTPTYIDFFAQLIDNPGPGVTAVYAYEMQTSVPSVATNMNHEIMDLTYTMMECKK